VRGTERGNFEDRLRKSPGASAVGNAFVRGCSFYQLSTSYNSQRQQKEAVEFPAEMGDSRVRCVLFRLFP
jgi:hypothetical protein